MKRMWTYVVALAAVLCAGSPAVGQIAGDIAAEIAAHCKGLPFSMPEPALPAVPDRHFVISDYGAVADGSTMNTSAFSATIAACAKTGGGIVEVPPGTWLTGPIKLESHINLHVQRGALVQFSSRVDDFPLIAGLDGKSKRYVRTPPIHAFRATDVAITGDGVFDGAGETWRYVKREKQTEAQWKELVASGGVVSADGKEWWLSKEAMNGEAYLKSLESSGKTPTMEDYASVREFLRPDMVQLVQCERILLDGPTFQNSPKFHVRPIQSENVVIRDVKVFSPWYGQNNDGVDPTSCRNVIIYNSTLDVGDDGLCLKPGTIAHSQKGGPACENIVIADCIVYHAHGGFVIGSESYGGVNNVSVRNCIFVGTDVGVRFKSMRGNGGLVENVFVDGIQMRNIRNEAILFDMYYGGGAPDEEAAKSPAQEQPIAVNDRTPKFQNITFKNIICNGSGQAMRMNGLPEMPIRNVLLQNVTLSGRKGVSLIDVEGIQLVDCRIAAQSSPTISILQGRNVTLKRGEYPGKVDVFLRVGGEASRDIRLDSVDVTMAKTAVEYGKGVRADAVTRH